MNVPALNQSSLWESRHQEKRDLSSQRSRNKNGTVLRPDSEETALNRAGLRETLQM